MARPAHGRKVRHVRRQGQRSGSRPHDRPVSNIWFRDNLLGVPVASLRRTAIQQPIQAVGRISLEVAAHTPLSSGGVGFTNGR